MDAPYHPFLVIAAIAVLAPLVNELPVRFRIPGVVLEIAMGIVAGPQVLDLVRPGAAVDALWKMGMVLLFLLAGMEIQFDRIRGLPLTLALRGWMVSLGVACVVAWILHLTGLVDTPSLVALALATTAIGTLLPILRDAGELPRRFGMLVMAAGAVGEFGPLLVFSVLPFQGQSVEATTMLMLLFAVVAALLALCVAHFRHPRVVELLGRTLYKTSQLPVRLVVLLAAGLDVLAVALGLDFLIGAFAAGMIVGFASRWEGAELLRHKLDGLGFGFLIPIFFVTTGVKFDLDALLGSTTSLLCVPLFLALFLVVRGLPVLLYRRELGGRDRLALAFYSATALPVVVAITQIGVATHRMRPDVAAALIGAAMLSLLLYPQVALALRSGAGTSRDAAATLGGNVPGRTVVEVTGPPPAFEGAAE